MNEVNDLSKSIKRWGWVVMILGILSLVAPFITGVTISVMVGMLLAIAGLSRLIHAFQGGGFWSGLLGIISGIAGVIMIINPMVGLASLTMVLVVYFLVQGVSEIIGAFSVRPVTGWGMMLFSGIISVLLAWLIWSQWPLSGAWAVGILIGVQLIFSGLAMITVGSAVKEMEV